MKVIRTISTLRRYIQSKKQQRKIIGFVPTMGSLHDGHAALLRRSKKENDVTVLSIFVNPKQFAAHEDFSKYPRDQKKDELLAKKENVDIIFHPSVKEMYPEGFLSAVDVESLGNVLCGKSRPGHFKGVATVVTKLLNVVSPDRMYLGQKDAQQIVILKKMVEDLNFPVKVKVVATVREASGLAMSSRNVYLNASERQEATVLYKALTAAKQKVLQGQRNPKMISQMISQMIEKHTHGRIDYVSCLDARSLGPVTDLSQVILIALAVCFPSARLIDNVLLKVK